MENRVKEGLENVARWLKAIKKDRLKEECTETILRNEKLDAGIVFVDSLLAALDKPGEDEKLILTALKVGKTGDDAIRRLGKFPKDEERLFYKAEDALSRLVLAAKLTDEERVRIKREVCEDILKQLDTAGHLYMQRWIREIYMKGFDRQLASLKEGKE